MITLETINEAKKNIEKIIKKTPLIHSQFLSEFCGGESQVYLKLENQQLTNSFKIRGALNRMIQMSHKEKSRGVVTASSGNHGYAVAFSAARVLQIPAKIVIPRNVSEAKLDKIKKCDVEIIQEGNFYEVEPLARQIAMKDGLTYVSPYNDPKIIAGQATIGLEILDELDHVDTIIVPVGGGGLISGIAIAVKTINPDTQIIGVQSEASPTLYDSWKAGKIVDVDEEDSLADGLMGGLEKGAITFELIQKHVDKLMLVKEETIRDAIYLIYMKEHQVVEGSGAIAIAPILENNDEFKEKTVVAVVSGGNILYSTLQQIIREVEGQKP